jgi:hypothetical protein
MPKSQEGQGLLFLARQAFRSALSRGGWARGWRVMPFPREEAWPPGEWIVQCLGMQWVSGRKV